MKIDLTDLRKLYEEALTVDSSYMIVEGTVCLTSYIKYVLEYAEGQSKGEY